MAFILTVRSTSLTLLSATKTRLNVEFELFASCARTLSFSAERTCQSPTSPLKPLAICPLASSLNDHTVFFPPFSFPSSPTTNATPRRGMKTAIKQFEKSMIDSPEKQFGSLNGHPQSVHRARKAIGSTMLV